VTNSRRPRRQGVVYGQANLHNSNDGAGVIGRLIGALIVVGAIVVLLVGALAVIGGGRDGAGGPTPTPTLPGLASPSPSSTPRPTPKPTATPTPSFGPSPSVSPIAVELVEGPGKITFASDYTGSNFDLVNPHVEFGINDQMAWRANIGDPVGQVVVDFNIFRVDPATGAETNVHTNSFTGRNPNARLYFAKAPVDHEVDGPGTFVMRYSVDGRTISEGYFRVTE
jgi:hypothetical protein